MDESCANCSEPVTEPHEVLLQSNTSTEVYLCDECHEALKQEFVWTS